MAALDRALERTDGPVVLVAHAYAGAVIAATTNERVQSLVFIAALAPDEGETVAEVFYREKPHPQAPQLAPDAHGLIWMPAGGICNRFLPTCIPRTRRTFCRNTAADRYRMHSGEGSKTRLESKAVLVPPRRRRPDDQPGHTALYGATHGRAHPVGEGRPYAIGHRARARHRSDPRCCGELGGVIEPSAGRNTPGVTRPALSWATGQDGLTRLEHYTVIHGEEEASNAEGQFPEGRRRRVQHLLSRGGVERRAGDPAAARFPERQPYVPRPHPETRGSVSRHRARSSRVRPVRHAGSRHVHLHIRQYRAGHRPA